MCARLFACGGENIIEKRAQEHGRRKNGDNERFVSSFFVFVRIFALFQQ